MQERLEHDTTSFNKKFDGTGALGVPQKRLTEMGFKSSYEECAPPLPVLSLPSDVSIHRFISIHHRLAHAVIIAYAYAIVIVRMRRCCCRYCSGFPRLCVGR